MTSLLFALLRLLLGTLYPAFASFKAVRTKNVREYVKWMMYWIVFALFTAFETVADILVAFWLPCYYEAKLLLLLWLISPVSKGSLGSSILYRKLVHPHLTRHEQELDSMVARVKEQSYNTATRFVSSAFNYATNLLMHTALRAPDWLAAARLHVQQQQSSISSTPSTPTLVHEVVETEEVENEEESEEMLQLLQSFVDQEDVDLDIPGRSTSTTKRTNSNRRSNKREDDDDFSQDEDYDLLKSKRRTNRTMTTTTRGSNTTKTAQRGQQQSISGTHRRSERNARKNSKKT